jgi:ATP-dependent DNA ligase
MTAPGGDQMITPMVARLALDPFDRKGWLFEIKWDGFRAIAETDVAGRVSLYSRTGPGPWASKASWPKTLKASRSKAP